ncbi:MAG: PHP domain-containing protein, partial [Aristaeellaceae bacterium]
MEQRRMDYHLHTVHSFDGEQSMDELCADMVSKGVQEICLTEHIEPGHPEEGVDVPPIWDVWLREIDAMRRKYPTLTI